MTTGPDLSEQASFSSIFRSWLVGHDDLGSATGEWSRFISSPVSRKIAPAWAQSGWSDDWWEEFRTILPDGKSVTACRANVDLLIAGQADVVITGQQPAVLGGPLYTLYKIASAIEAARWRCEIGQPTVPVFWLGDDDQDAAEAMSGRIFDPQRRCFLSVGDIQVEDACMVGALPARTWDTGMLNWLNSLSAPGPLAITLRRIWQESITAGESTSRLFRKFILRLFPESGLLIVSGNDSRMHRLAEPVYKAIIPRLDTLRKMASRQGQELSEAGWHAQISDRSLENPLYQASGHRRLKITDAGGGSVGYGSLRPGVMLRSLVQDWLFRPLATIVGPAELAYHMQLRPLYDELGINHPALLPRLFATVTISQETGRDEEDRPSDYELEMVSSNALTGTEAELVKYLGDGLELSPEEAATRLTPLMTLLRNRVNGFLERQYDRVELEAHKEQEPWLAPFGKRQERVMSTGWAAALWGETLVHNVKLAAYVHYKRGAAGEWLDMMMKVGEKPLTRSRR